MTKEQKRLYDNIYYQKNKAKRQEQKKIWAKSNDVRLSEYYRIYRQDHKMHRRKLARDWRKSWPDDLRKEMNEKDRKRTRAWRLRVQYGLTEDEVSQALLIQGFVCKICKRGNIQLVIDHCHKTKKFRGMLCHRCNHLIGHALENITTLENAIEYLKTNTLPSL